MGDKKTKTTNVASKVTKDSNKDKGYIADYMKFVKERKKNLIPTDYTTLGNWIHDKNLRIKFNTAIGSYKQSHPNMTPDDRRLLNNLARNLLNLYINTFDNDRVSPFDKSYLTIDDVLNLYTTDVAGDKLKDLDEIKDDPVLKDMPGYGPKAWFNYRPYYYKRVLQERDETDDVNGIRDFDWEYDPVHEEYKVVPLTEKIVHRGYVRGNDFERYDKSRLKDTSNLISRTGVDNGITEIVKRLEEEKPLSEPEKIHGKLQGKYGKLQGKLRRGKLHGGVTVYRNDPDAAWNDESDILTNEPDYTPRDPGAASAVFGEGLGKGYETIDPYLIPKTQKGPDGKEEPVYEKDENGVMHVVMIPIWKHPKLQHELFDDDDMLSEGAKLARKRAAERREEHADQLKAAEQKELDNLIKEEKRQRLLNILEGLK